ncbi:hypothetical protein [Shouchella clausii]|uniref:Uncharacterized protein n=1 Tax=Shouchella clausii TaxID=79880 RepID=A0A268RZW6_SHOCL|nr:hypothetical protein [Shouchella clausii]PAD41401.1 hypothetical protein CHH54_17600 [Bacillus sp. 7520-S]MBU8595840.1 hypothetical protein [Shouchella clausii]MCY1106068.1 hypothetical protein [Shouchella clausii]MED4158381.1 hypothetical protein [Shouchella clausii]MED4177763.1 hypothetical protein [Shouchella clausii]
MPERDEQLREEEARRSEETLRFAEDLIYYAAILGGIATAMDLVGLTIAREEARKAETEVEEELETPFPQQPPVGFTEPRNNGRDGQSAGNQSSMQRKVENMEREMKQLQWQMKRIESMLHRR